MVLKRLWRSLQSKRVMNKTLMKPKKSFRVLIGKRAWEALQQTWACGLNVARKWFRCGLGRNSKWEKFQGNYSTKDFLILWYGRRLFEKKCCCFVTVRDSGCKWSDERMKSTVFYCIHSWKYQNIDSHIPGNKHSRGSPSFNEIGQLEKSSSARKTRPHSWLNLACYQGGSDWPSE